jgi:hypothetical protein
MGVNVFREIEGSSTAKTQPRTAINQILRQAVPNPIGPEFMAPPARTTAIAWDT